MLKRGGWGSKVDSRPQTKLATRMVAQIWGFLGNAAYIFTNGGAA